MMSKSEPDARRAFTLIELLVVVAILAILVSILLPSLARARKQAKQVKCAAHLKAMGMGIFYYAEDKSNGNGYLPQLGRFIDLYRGAYWVTQIMPYVKVKRSQDGSPYAFLRCPADENPSYRFITGPRPGAPATREDKLLADVGEWRTGSSGRGRGGSAGPAAAQRPLIEPVSYAGSCDLMNSLRWPGTQGLAVSPRKLIRLDRPYCQALITEAPLRPSGDSYFSWGHFDEALTSTDLNTLKVYRRHYGGMNPNRNGANWLFADGHVKWHSVAYSVRKLVCCQDFGVPGPESAFLEHARQHQKKQCAATTRGGGGGRGR